MRRTEEPSVFSPRRFSLGSTLAIIAASVPSRLFQTPFGDAVSSIIRRPLSSLGTTSTAGEVLTHHLPLGQTHGRSHVPICGTGLAQSSGLPPVVCLAAFCIDICHRPVRQELSIIIPEVFRELPILSRFQNTLLWQRTEGILNIETDCHAYSTIAAYDIDGPLHVQHRLIDRPARLKSMWGLRKPIFCGDMHLNPQRNGTLQYLPCFIKYHQSRAT